MKQKITLTDLAPLLAATEGLTTSEAEAFLRAYFEVISEALTEEKFVKIKGFGTFKLVTVSERESVNINTGERFRIGSHTKVTFTPESSLKELVNRPFAHFETVDLSDDTSIEELAEIDREAEAEVEAIAQDTEEAKEEGTAAETTQTMLQQNAVEEGNEAAGIETSDDPLKGADAEPNSEHSPAPSTSAAGPSSDQQPKPNLEPNVVENASLAVEANPKGQDALSSQQEEVAEQAPLVHAETDSAPDPNVTAHAQRLVSPQADDISPQPATEEESATETGNTPSSNSMPSDSQKSNDDQQTYTRQRRCNPWKIAALTLGLIILTGGSYFAGYFRLLCPCSLPIVERWFITPSPETPVQQPLPATKTKPAPAPIQPTPETPLPASGTTDRNARPKTKPSLQAPTAAPTPPPLSPPENTKPAKKSPTYHIVEKGDNLSRLSRRYYGSDKYINRILEANGLKNADNIVLGMKLIIPAP